MNVRLVTYGERVGLLTSCCDHQSHASQGHGNDRDDTEPQKDPRTVDVE